MLFLQVLILGGLKSFVLQLLIVMGLARDFLQVLERLDLLSEDAKTEKICRSIRNTGVWELSECWRVIFLERDPSLTMFAQDDSVAPSTTLARRKPR